MAPSPQGQNPPSGFYGDRPGPEYSLYIVWCGDEYRGTVWLGPRNFTDANVQPIVDELVKRVTMLPAGVDVRPESRGVTGIPSLFWVAGYGGAPLQATESAFGLTVTVTAELVGVEWDFGDGTPVVQSGLGEAWPERSSVQHNYRYRSGDQPYRVTARVLLRPRYTVNGAAGAALQAISVPITRDYVVHEVQAVGRA